MVMLSAIHEATAATVLTVAAADELASARDLPGGLAAPFCVEAGLREGRKAGPLGSRPLGSSRDVRSEAEVRSYVLNTPASGRE